jgi:hypothetical protein
MRKAPKPGTNRRARAAGASKTCSGFGISEKNGMVSTTITTAQTSTSAPGIERRLRSSSQPRARQERSASGKARQSASRPRKVFFSHGATASGGTRSAKRPHRRFRESGRSQDVSDAR